MQKFKHIFLGGFLVFATFGTGVFLSNLEDARVRDLRVDVLESIPAVSESFPAAIVDSAVVPAVYTVAVPAVFPAVDTKIESESTTLAEPSVLVESSKSVEPSVSVELPQSTEPSTTDSSAASPVLPPSTPDSPVVDSSTDSPVADPPLVEGIMGSLYSSPVETSISDQADDAVKIVLEEVQKQPQVNTKILDAIGALRNVPQLFAESENDYGSQRLLKIITGIITDLTDNLQQNTVALENTLNFVYQQQGAAISQGRCIMTLYFTYSDAENDCMLIRREVCKTGDIVPDNRYENMDSCREDHVVIQSGESREALAFRKQKEEYLRRLASLQQAYKYYSVRWEELVDIAKDSHDFESLGIVGNAINLYRTENEKPLEQEEELSVEQTVEIEKKVEQKIEVKTEKEIPAATKLIPDDIDSSSSSAARTRQLRKILRSRE